MSYDIYLRNPVTGKTAEVPGHLMCGGTYQADYHPESGNEIKDIITIINENMPVRKEKVEFEVSEGDTSDYWLDTAANAIKPLYQLIALAKMRPDCIWDGD